MSCRGRSGSGSPGSAQALPEHQAAGAGEADHGEQAAAEHDRPQPRPVGLLAPVASRISSLPMKPESGGRPTMAMRAQEEQAGQEIELGEGAVLPPAGPRPRRAGSRPDRRAGTAPRPTACCAPGSRGPRDAGRARRTARPRSAACPSSRRARRPRRGRAAPAREDADRAERQRQRARPAASRARRARRAAPAATAEDRP